MGFVVSVIPVVKRVTGIHSYPVAVMHCQQEIQGADERFRESITMFVHSLHRESVQLMNL